MPTLAEAVVEYFLTMLDAEEWSLFSSAAQIMELEFTAANILKMLELDAQVLCDYSSLHFFNVHYQSQARAIM